jgi:hypothetical protein
VTVKPTSVLAVIFCVLLSVQAQAIEVKPGGELFLDYKYAFPSNSQEEASLFEVTRGYLTLKSELADRILGRITYEVYQAKDREIEVWDGTQLVTVTSYSEDNTLIRLKYAYLEYNNQGIYSKFKFGLHQTEWIEVANKTWKHRYVAKTLLDYWGVETSADYGISWYGDLPTKYFRPVVQALNGSGYSKKEENKLKDLESLIYIYPLPDKEMFAGSWIGGGYYYGFPNKAVMKASSSKEDFFLLGGSLDYRDWFTLTAEYFGGQYNENTDLGDDTESSGFSVYGDLRFTSLEGSARKMVLIGRYDSYDPDTGVEDDKADLIILGAGCNVTKGVSFMLDYQSLMYEASGVDSKSYLYLHGLVKF